MNEVETPTGIFGVSLQSSIKYANVAISFMDDRGESSVYGYVPIVVAKCGVFLKEKGKHIYEPERLGLSADPFRPLQPPMLKGFSGSMGLQSESRSSRKSLSPRIATGKALIGLGIQFTTQLMS